MADIHVLDGTYEPRNGLVWKRVVFHFPIDVGDQVAAAADDPALVAFVSEVPDLATDDPTENTAIKNGQTVERVVTVSFHRDSTGADRLALIRQKYADMTTEVTQSYRARYYEYTSTFTAT